ncbi:hypothetical protein EV426DRAFT_298762 [Tirmania nivea]|nr:hypothetical protein EV426DRAFT_298762 [Tirmania nivea]
MPSCTAITLATLKIGSTAALGILTGAHLAFSLSTIQAILTLPSASHARHAFATTLTTHTNLLTRPLTVIPTLLLTATYLVSPSRLRHPYLLMAATLPGLSLLYDCGVLAPMEVAISNRPGGVGVVDDEGVDVEDLDVNGEVVRGDLERYRKGNLVKAGMVAVAFLVGVVGNWGDGWVGYGF